MQLSRFVTATKTCPNHEFEKACQRVITKSALVMLAQQAPFI